jgi:hypothetical protein
VPGLGADLNKCIVSCSEKAFNFQVHALRSSRLTNKRMNALVNQKTQPQIRRNHGRPRKKTSKSRKNMEKGP